MLLMQEGFITPDGSNFGVILSGFDHNVLSGRFQSLLHPSGEFWALFTATRFSLVTLECYLGPCVMVAFSPRVSKGGTV